MRNRLIIISAVVLVSLYIALPKTLNIKGTSITRRDFGLNTDLKLGLDLVGGSHLEFDVEANDLSEDKKKNALESLQQVIERRVNLFGVSEPSVSLTSFEGKERIVVELPGIKDTNQAISLIGKTAQLTFMQLDQDALKEASDSANLENALVPTDLTGADLKSADVSFSDVSAEPVVVLEFTSEGENKFSQLTEKNVGSPLPIALDGEVISAPVVQEKISGGTAQITGEFSIEEAKQLAIQLNAGALPVSIQLVNERTVGASLGKESVQKSIKAGLIGLGLVLVFMIIFYGELGLVADVGLVIFAIITLALYKAIPVVLTLPGIAGFMLSVGMAVDSNILIFERFREEKAKGVNLSYALETSFGRAWDSIRDANIATLVTAFVLANPLDWPFLHVSGPVRGFAITLAIGIGVSLFTGVYVSRNLLRLFIDFKKEK